MPVATTAGAAIDYVDTGGDGFPVLLLHAFPLRAAMWEAQVEALSPRFRVLAPDLKGFGSSDRPEDLSAYSMDSYADEARAVLDAAGAGSAAVVGLSMGGYVALAMWRRHRDAIFALVLADTRAEADTPEGVARRSDQQEVARVEGPAALRDTLVQALLGQSTRRSRPDVVDRVTALMDAPAAGYVGALEAMKSRPDSTGDLASIDVPVLVVVGEEDVLTPVDAARRLRDGVAGAQLVVVPGAGHLTNLEAPDAFSNAVAGFLASL